MVDAAGGGCRARRRRCDRSGTVWVLGIEATEIGGEGIEVREFDLPEAVHVDGVASSIDGLEGIWALISCRTRAIQVRQGSASVPIMPTSASERLRCLA